MDSDAAYRCILWYKNGLRHSDEVFLPANAKQTWLDWAATEPWLQDAAGEFSL
jgi:hypothetical protein